MGTSRNLRQKKKKQKHGVAYMGREEDFKKLVHRTDKPQEWIDDKNGLKRISQRQSPDVSNQFICYGC